jgi:hypothetical protein
MSDQRIPSQWQLQNTGESLEQWMLHEEEQNLPSHMQLSQQQGSADDPYNAQYQGQYQGQSPQQYGQMPGSPSTTAPCSRWQRVRPTAAA